MYDDGGRGGAGGGGPYASSGGRGGGGGGGSETTSSWGGGDEHMMGHVAQSLMQTKLPGDWDFSPGTIVPSKKHSQLSVKNENFVGFTTSMDLETLFFSWASFGQDFVISAFYLLKTLSSPRGLCAFASAISKSLIFVLSFVKKIGCFCSLLIICCNALYFFFKFVIDFTIKLISLYIVFFFTNWILLYDMIWLIWWVKLDLLE